MKSLTICLLVVCPFAGSAQTGVVADAKQLRVEFNDVLHSRIVAKLGAKEIVLSDFLPSEFINIGGTDVKDFAIGSQKREVVRDKIGSGQRVSMTGSAKNRFGNDL